MPECHSTNSLALQHCQQTQTPAEGTIIITSNQTAGRGQRGSTWSSEPGKNLTFSMILKPTFLSIPDQFFLNIFVSLGIYDYIKNVSNLNVSIKWPNDIYIGSKKICGVLIENQIQGQWFTHSVIGVGLNINQQAFELPTPTSLSLETGQEFDLNEELEKLLKVLEARYLQLRNNKREELIHAYRDALHWLNEVHTFSSGDGEFKGIIQGVDEAGKLVVENDRQLRSFGLKEISFVR